MWLLSIWGSGDAVPAPPHNGCPAKPLTLCMLEVTYHSFFHILCLLPKARFPQKLSIFPEQSFAQRDGLPSGLRIRLAVGSAHSGQHSAGLARKCLPGLTAVCSGRSWTKQHFGPKTEPGFPKALGCWAHRAPWHSRIVSRAHLGKVKRGRDRWR